MQTGCQHHDNSLSLSLPIYPDDSHLIQPSLLRSLRNSSIATLVLQQHKLGHRIDFKATFLYSQPHLEATLVLQQCHQLLLSTQVTITGYTPPPPEQQTYQTITIAEWEQELAEADEIATAAAVAAQRAADAAEEVT